LFEPCNDDALLVDNSHVLDLRSNPLKEREDNII
jgi:hypothetical protein